jgi:DNA-directed RNA polymerase subunit K/omega
MAAGQDNNKVVLAALMEVASKYLNPHGHEDHGAPI